MLGVGRCRAIYNWCSVRMYVLQIRPQGEGVKRLAWIRRSMVYRSRARPKIDLEARRGIILGRVAFLVLFNFRVRNEPVSVVCNIVRQFITRRLQSRLRRMQTDRIPL